MSTGYVLYDGPSKINNKRIVVIATGFGKSQSRNAKTGNMIQTWILTPDLAPLEAHKAGDDFAICGNCKQRKWETCYVNKGTGLWQVWDGFRRGIYSVLKNARVFENCHVRVGSYGDPSSVPTKVWNRICKYAIGWTGYTHSWNSRWIDVNLKKYCMASCDTEKEVKQAIALGYRPFYVRPRNATLPKGFFACPAAKESGKKSNCSKCLSCKGGSFNSRPCPSIEIHGPSWKIARFEAMLKLYKSKKRYAFTPTVRNGKVVS